MRNTTLLMPILLVIILLTSCSSDERVKEKQDSNSDPFTEQMPEYRFGSFTPSPPNHWPEAIPLPWDMVVTSSYYQAPLERLETIFSRRDESTPTPSLAEIRESYLKGLPREWEQVDAPPLAFNKGSLRLSFTKDDETLDLYGLELSDNHDVHLTMIYSSKGDIKLPIDLGLMPKDWPEDIPLAPAMKLYSGKTDAMGRKMVTLLGREDPKSVLGYYVENLSNWELDRDYEGSSFDAGNLTFSFIPIESTSPTSQLDIEIKKDGEFTWVTITLSPAE